MEKQKGAAIERGVILSASQDLYTVKSLDRDGIESPPIGAADSTTYQHNLSAGRPGVFLPVPGRNGENPVRHDIKGR